MSPALHHHNANMEGNTQAAASSRALHGGYSPPAAAPGQRLGPRWNFFFFFWRGGAGDRQERSGSALRACGEPRRGRLSLPPAPATFVSGTSNTWEPLGRWGEAGEPSPLQPRGRPNFSTKEEEEEEEEEEEKKKKEEEEKAAGQGLAGWRRSGGCSRRCWRPPWLAATTWTCGSRWSSRAPTGPSLGTRCCSTTTTAPGGEWGTRQTPGPGGKGGASSRRAALNGGKRGEKNGF